MKRLVLVGLVSLVGLGCSAPTNFQGEATFPKGARGCYDQCIADGMEMAAFVYVGSYSTACACKLKGTPQSQSVSETAAGAAHAAAVAGVEMQRRRTEQERQQSLIRQQSTQKKAAEPYRPIGR